jgi:hypothetical protein
MSSPVSLADCQHRPVCVGGVVGEEFRFEEIYRTVME